MALSSLGTVEQAIDCDDLDNLRLAIAPLKNVYEMAEVLAYGVRASSTSCVRVLLEAGCDPFLRHQRRSALDTAVVTDDVNMLNLLLHDYVPLIQSDTAAAGFKSSVEDDRVPENQRCKSPAPVSGAQNTRKDGCFAFCRLGSNSKRSELQKQMAKIERAMNTALFTAACHASVKCAERLLLLAADVNATCYHDDEILSWCSPLISACAAPITSTNLPVCTPNVTQMVNLLIEHGADVTACTNFGQTALHWASRAGLVSVVSQLLERGAAINARDKIGQTAIMSACDYAGSRCVDVCRLLITWKADLWCRGEKDDYTAFHFAVGSNHLPLVELFLSTGISATTGTHLSPAGDVTADPSSWQQLTPLDIAVNNNQLDVVKCLLRCYADINAPSHYNQTVTTGGGLIYLATESLQITRLLIDVGYDANSCLLVAKNRYLKRNIRELLQTAREIPPLRHVCRLTIRSAIAQRYKRSAELPLPRALISYVNMEDLLS